MPQDMSWFLSNANNLVAVVVANYFSGYFKVFNLRLQSLVIAAMLTALLESMDNCNIYLQLKYRYSVLYAANRPVLQSPLQLYSSFPITYGHPHPITLPHSFIHFCKKIKFCLFFIACRIM